MDDHETEISLRLSAGLSNRSRGTGMFRLRVAAVRCMGAIMLVACGTADFNFTRTRIELDIFSGRPNPSWTITSLEADTLAALLADLSAAVAPAEVALGYRGFLVGADVRSSPETGLTRVFSGAVSRGKLHFADSKGAEQWLKTNARKYGFGAIVDSIRLR